MNWHNEVMICILNLKVWYGQRLDKGLSMKIDHQEQAEKGTVKAVKLLVPKKILEPVHQASRKIRMEYGKRTSPWIADGSRIISTRKIFDFTSEIKTLSERFSEEVDKFLSEYESLRLSSDFEKRMGMVYDPWDYPEADILRNSFHNEIRYLPVPSDTAAREVSATAEIIENAFKSAQEMKKTYMRHWLKIALELAQSVVAGLKKNRLHKKTVQMLLDIGKDFAEEKLAMPEQFRDLGDGLMEIAILLKEDMGPGSLQRSSAKIMLPEMVERAKNYIHMIEELEL